eukprot:s282_g34.t1
MGTRPFYLHADLPAQSFYGHPRFCGRDLIAERTFDLWRGRQFAWPALADPQHEYYPGNQRHESSPGSARTLQATDLR